MKKLSVILLALVLVGCFSKYSMLKSQVKNAVTPKEIIEVAISIQTSSMPAEDKQALTIELAKRSIKIFSLFAKDIFIGNVNVTRGEIKDILNFIINNIDSFNSISKDETNKLIVSLTQIMIRNMNLAR